MAWPKLASDAPDAGGCIRNDGYRAIDSDAPPQPRWTSVSSAVCSGLSEFAFDSDQQGRHVSRQGKMQVAQFRPEMLMRHDFA